MSTLTATAMDKEWAACSRYSAKSHRSERVTRESMRGFSKLHASVRLIAVAFAGAALFGTHASLCYQFCPIAVAMLVVCLLLSSSTKQTNTQSQSKRYCFSFRYPDHGELFYLRANMIEQACREPRTLLTTPFYVKRLRLIHDAPDTDEDSNAEGGWRFDDPKFLQECHYVWEVFGADEPPSTEPDKDGFRFVDFTCKRA